MGIIPPLKVDPEEQRDILNELLDHKDPKARTPQAEEQSPQNGPGTFSIDDLGVRYFVHGLWKPYHPGETYSLEICASLLDQSREHTQHEWQISPQLRTMHATVWELPSGPDYASLMLGLYAHKDDSRVQQNMEKLYRMLRHDFNMLGLMTSTHITYREWPFDDGFLGLFGSRIPVKDEVAHHYGTLVETRHEVDLRKQGGPIDHTKEEQLYALFGTRDIATFRYAVEWITGKLPHLACENGSPYKETTNAMLLYVSDSANYFQLHANSENRGFVRGMIVHDNIP